MFHLTRYYAHFLPKTKLDFLTIKDNRGRRYQSMDSIRKLISRYYESYVIVGSPTGGRHWHILGSREGPRKIRVPRGIHFHADMIGRSAHSNANRKPREDPMDPDAGLYAQIRYIVRKAPPTTSSKGVSKAVQVSTVLGYMLVNLLENETYDQFNHCYARLN